MNGGAEIKIRGTPTKELFIEMLTRDLSLVAAIIDLVDNSTDGARRLRLEEDFEGLWVRIEVSEQSFKIVDNCGGIPFEVARDYAFRFGRAKDMEPTKHSVGQFGVGMKRAIFKMGDHFFVESKTDRHQFTIDQDIKEWAQNADDWDFSFATLEETGVPEQERGTKICVTRLKDDVASVFSGSTWTRRLSEELRIRLQQFMSQGLSVSVNGTPVQVDPLELLSDAGLRPAYKSVVFDKEDPPVSLKLWCGLGNSEAADLAGWHVFCNGRLVLEADQTEVTGWGVTAGVRLPQFHPQFNRFRGYAFFDSDDAGRLPWNTTKTGLDTDSPVYLGARTEMNLLARPVIDFLNQLKTEKERRKASGKDDPGPLEEVLQAARSLPLKEVDAAESFVAPKPIKTPNLPSRTGVTYSVDRDRMATVKRLLKVTTNKEVGLQTFEYFWEAEVESFDQ